MHSYKNMADNGVLPGIVGFKWLRLCEAFCSAVWTVEREMLIMIGYQTKLSPAFVRRPRPSITLAFLLFLFRQG